MFDEASIIAADRALVEKGTLYDFLEMAWPHVEVERFIPGWHLEELCIHLEAVSNCQIKRLVINQPPGTGKSSTTGWAWPVWEWIKRPPTKFIYASFDQSLVCRDADKMIKLLSSDWFRARWGDLLLKGKPASSDFSNRQGGFRFSTSVNGKVTGRHANIQVADDPIKPKDAAGGSTMRKTVIRAVSDWWSGTMSSRASNLETLRRIVIMQRLDTDDLAGECIANGYELLRLPMRFEVSEPCKTTVGGDRRTTEGELLCPERASETAVAKQESEMGPDVAAAQLQQRPNRKGGGIFREAWWRYWVPDGMKLPPVYRPDGSEAPTRTVPIRGLKMQSWDMTFKDSDGSDFVCGGVWLAYDDEFFLLDLLNQRLDFPGTLQEFRAMCAKWPDTFDKLVENKANGPAVEQTLRQEIPGIVLCEPMGGKEARANAVSPLCASGRVWIPHPMIAPWVTAYRLQHERFPRAVNDDMVDMTTQALLHLRKHGNTFSEAMAALRGQKK